MSITELSKIKKDELDLTFFFEETMQKAGPDTIITETEDMETLTGVNQYENRADFHALSVRECRYHPLLYFLFGLIGFLMFQQQVQLSFGIREQNDMEIILKMKHLYFSLHEIHEYLDIHRMNNMVEEESLTDSRLCR